MLVVGFSTPPPLPGLPSRHPQRGPLRQIGEDYGLSQGPHWEHGESLSSAGQMASTHPLCRSTAGRAESKLERQAGQLVFQFGLCLQREHKLTHSHSRPQTERCCGERSKSTRRGFLPQYFRDGRLDTIGSESFSENVLEIGLTVFASHCENQFKSRQHKVK